MKQNENYILILKDSLKKKLTILNELITLNDRQKAAISGQTIDSDEFDTVIDKKAEYIEEIEELDRGFQTVYEHIKEELSLNKENYKNDIIELKQLISEITEKSMEVQISEKRNEKLVYNKFAEERNKIRKSRTANKVASDYYKSMSKVNIIDPQFMDKKK